MAINFNSLPKTGPSSIVESGVYIGVIDMAEMKAPKDPTKPDFLNVRYTLKKDGQVKGTMYDIFTESDSEIARFKLYRFLVALGLDSLQTFELRDLPKLILNKELEMDVTIQKSEGYADKNVVDVFSNDIFRPITGESEINAPDAADATPATPTDNLSY